MSNDLICDICGFTFTKLSALKSHQTRNEYCKVLKNSIIKCKICKQEFDNLNLYSKHQCDVNNINNNENINDDSDQIEKYKLLINIYRDIIKKNCNINVSMLDDIEINNVDDIKITRKESIEIPKETDIQTSNQVNNIEDDLDFVNRYETEMKDLILNLSKNKQYNKVLVDIKNLRKKLFKYISFNEYQDILHTNVKDIEKVLLERFNEERKCTKILKKAISPLEIRFFMRKGLETTNLEIDETDLLKSSITYQNRNSKYEIFSQETFINKFLNYSVALYSLKDLFCAYIPENNNFNNLVYVNMPRSKRDNPYSFYYLENISNNKLSWKMDCRLDNLISYLITNIHSHCILLFRKIYNQIYHDNDYRDNFYDDYNVLEIEGKNLINTLLISCDQYKFSNVLFDVIIKNCTKIENENDKFNLRSDDNILKNSFNEIRYKDCKTSKENAIKQLFDNIRDDDIQKLIN